MEYFKATFKEREFVVGHLQKALGNCSVFIFGYRRSSIVRDTWLRVSSCKNVETHHFDLVVFTDKAMPIDIGQLVATISAESDHCISVCILLHTLSDLGTKRESQAWFFNRVLKECPVLVLQSGATPYVLHCNAKRDWKGDGAFWQKCEAVALFYLDAAGNSVHEDVVLCKIALLHTAVSQIALGLVRVHLGYSPKYFGLRFLLQLCGSFSTLALDLFPVASAAGLRRYRMLCCPPDRLRNWIRLDAAAADFEILYYAAQDFLELGGGLVLAELERLEFGTIKNELL